MRSLKLRQIVGAARGTSSRATAWVGVVLLSMGWAAAASGEIVRQTDLVGWWRMGEGAVWDGAQWIVPDASGNGHTATSVRMTQADRVPGYPFADYPETSYAMRFDGPLTQKHLSCPYHPSLALGSSFTLSAWVKQETPTSGDRNIVSRCDPGLRHNYALQLKDSRVHASFYYQGWPHATGATTLNLGEWYHVAAVFDDAANTYSVYYNGTLDAQTLTTGTPATSSLHGVDIGGEAAENTRWFSGTIDDVRIYGAALTPAEIAAVYNSGMGDFGDEWVSAYEWRGGAAGSPADWGNAENWNPNRVPNQRHATVNLGTSGAAPEVDLGSEDRTVGTLNLHASVPTSVQSGGGRALLLDNAALPAMVAAAGNHRIGAPVHLLSDLLLANEGDLWFDAPVSGEKDVNHAGSGITHLAAANTHTGATRLSAGTVVLHDSLALQRSTLRLGAGDTGELSFGALNSATLGGLAGLRNLVLIGASNQPVQLSVGAHGADCTYGGSLHGKGGLVKVGDGILTLTGPSDYEGPTVIRQGTLRLAGGNQLVGFGGDGTGWTVNNHQISGAAVADNVLTLTTGGGNQARSAFYDQRIPVTEGFAVEFTYSATGTGTLADGMTFTIQNDPRGPAALGGRGHNLGYGAEGSFPAISPSLALLFNLFSTSGVRWSTNGQVGGYTSTSPVNLVGGNPIDVSLTYEPFAQTLTETLRERNTTNTKTFVWTGINLEGILGTTDAYVGFTGATGGFTATQTISNFTATFGGLQGSDLLPTGTDLRIAAGATLDLGGVHQAVGSLGDDETGGGGAVLLGGATLTVGGNGADATFSGSIAGSGAVVKTGGGRWTLSGDHAYAGPATVEHGALVVDGSLSPQSSVLVQGEGTLGGRGAVGGQVTVEAGGRITPGSSVGTLTVGRLTLEPGSVLDIEFGPAGHDRIAVTGLDGLLIHGAGVNLFHEGATTPFAAPGTYPVLQFQGQLGGGGLDALSILNPQPGIEYSFDVTSHPGWVSVTVVPEPAAWLMLAAVGLVGLCASACRRRRKR
jgi:autotransporter-associated beta strand protein